jgi:hypothetical protein
MSTTEQGTVKGFTTRALLAAVAAWMDEHPLTAPLVEQVQVTDLSKRRAGYDVSLWVPGGDVEIGIMADALYVERTSARLMGKPYRLSDGSWMRNGGFSVERPDGAWWSVTVTAEVSDWVDTGSGAGA